MNLTFNQVEAVFAQRFGIPSEKAVAFRGRLQHLQRLNFPSGVNTGRGKKANYGWVQVIQLMVVLDLIDLGITPDVAARGVKQGTDRLMDAVCSVISGFETGEALAKALTKARCPFGITQMAIASAYALTLMHGRDEPTLILTQTGREFTDQLNKDPAIEPAAAFINLGSRMMLVGQMIGRVVPLDPIEVAMELFKWSGDWAEQGSVS